MFNFQNAGEIWTAISAGISLLVIIIALNPIIKESINKRQYKTVLRNKALFDCQHR